MLKTYDTLEQATHVQPRVTALLACQNNLMPASWHMPISKSPFRYAVAVREENYTHELINDNKSFTLNFIPFEHYEMIDRLGHIHGDNVDKIKLMDIKKSGHDRHGNPLLNIADFIYECEVCDTYKNGDHTIFISDVVKIHVNDKQSNMPILFSGRGKYSTVGKTSTVSKSKGL